MLVGTSKQYPADPIHTPAHIVPEWYFLPFYAILRSIPNKIGGVLAMIFAILILLLLPIVNTSEIRSTTFRPLFKTFLWILIGDFLFLGWVGQKAGAGFWPFLNLGVDALFDGSVPINHLAPIGSLVRGWSD
jgi:ubiquinol-cytochrome c reductase cytochrome b/c1 subunit